jgi:hypothetical protein
MRHRLRDGMSCRSTRQAGTATAADAFAGAYSGSDSTVAAERSRLDLARRKSAVDRVRVRMINRSASGSANHENGGRP